MKKIIFLHIPKTAGQSVHQFLEDTFGAENISPTRVNDQLLTASINELRRYNIFSGHLDWSLLDCVGNNTFTFTILRKPEDRILSFYFYLRSKGENMSQNEINSPTNQGIKAAYELSPDEYFADPGLNIRGFLDNHYHNFYTFYFAGRTYDSRQKLISKIGANDAFDSMDDIVSLAMENMKTIDKVYELNSWTNLYKDLKDIFPEYPIKEDEYFINKGKNLSLRKRYDEIKKLGATSLTLNKIEEMCHYDNIIYNNYFEH